MDVVDPLNYNPRMPSASMNGSNNLFKPGGLTSGGVPEIATDLLPSSQVYGSPFKRLPVKSKNGPMQEKGFSFRSF